VSEEFLSSIEDVIEDAQNGKMYILVDDEDRENEGDLIIPGQMATPDAINFMAKHGRGLICLTMTGDRIRELGLPLMSAENECRHQTAFTVSIEAKEGVTTGISAADRARTISVAVDQSHGKDDIVSPGHVFPLMARDGGVLVRAGHTEASVDISRLAGLNPSAVICEIMNDDGTMARIPDLIRFSQEHGLKVGTIRDLIEYRRKHDNLVECSVENTLISTHGGDWIAKTYVNKAEYAEHLVLVKGTINPNESIMVRMHALNLFDDLLSEVGDRAGQLSKSMEMIGEEGTGVVVIIRDTRVTRLSETMKVRNGDIPDGMKTDTLRDYGIGAQILNDLGVKDMILLSNTKRTVIGLDGYHLNIVEQRPIK
jgi:3,4-dihydroxy 2-butanone 4-phosphate synthase/GTP cyclohydrolase II